ncbi:saccharopine dehydrogenase NADP-binding domain-containing protein [Gammaproteobacteria bacterium]|nr:saccharopine dehydrogenase NADP-binding domain-containing protein [Gammaproteobacteria bacterium]MDC0410096.1 saccharopine dehydrogenase NADP-binding domain-containing protein [Gammaproteobacteria bacterium]
MSKDSEFDFVVYGATGFTGKLVVEYLQEKYSDNNEISWAMAGRSLEKLNQVKLDLGLSSSVKTLEVNSNDQASIDNMMESTKCVLTTVGPYQLYGNEIVKSCAETGTDYVDLCGEPGWMHGIISEHTDKAKETGARIVFSCGFDSIPFDLGVLFLQDEVKKQTGKTSSKVRARVRVMEGEFSGGTAASFGATMASLRSNPELLNILANPFSLSEGFQGPEQENDSKPIFDEALGVWVAPFFMAPINTKNVHRSNMLLNHSYGEDFLYNEMWVSGPGEEGEQIANMMATANPMSGDDVPKPGEGPSRKSREAGSYDVLFYTDVEGKTISTSVTGDMDPGYGSTSKMIAESAICLVKDTAELAGGIYTPASSMGKKLIERLVKNAGLTFNVE